MKKATTKECSILWSCHLLLFSVCFIIFVNISNILGISEIYRGLEYLCRRWQQKGQRKNLRWVRLVWSNISDQLSWKFEQHDWCKNEIARKFVWPGQTWNRPGADVHWSINILCLHHIVINQTHVTSLIIHNTTQQGFSLFQYNSLHEWTHERGTYQPQLLETPRVSSTRQLTKQDHRLSCNKTLFLASLTRLRNKKH